MKAGSSVPVLVLADKCARTCSPNGPLMWLAALDNRSMSRVLWNAKWYFEIFIACSACSRLLLFGVASPLHFTTLR
jgi:hypothetical protein